MKTRESNYTATGLAHVKSSHFVKYQVLYMYLAILESKDVLWAGHLLNGYRENPG